MKMIGVVAHAPCDVALFRDGAVFVRLAFDARLHDVISANGAIIHDNVCAAARSHVSCRRAPFGKALHCVPHDHMATALTF